MLNFLPSLDLLHLVNGWAIFFSEYYVSFDMLCNLRDDIYH